MNDAWVLFNSDDETYLSTHSSLFSSYYFTACIQDSNDSKVQWTNEIAEIWFFQEKERAIQIVNKFVNRKNIGIIPVTLDMSPDFFNPVPEEEIEEKYPDTKYDLSDLQSQTITITGQGGAIGSLSPNPLPEFSKYYPELVQESYAKIEVDDSAGMGSAKTKTFGQRIKERLKLK